MRPRLGPHSYIGIGAGVTVDPRDHCILLLPLSSSSRSRMRTSMSDSIAL